MDENKVLRVTMKQARRRYRVLVKAAKRDGRTPLPMRAWARAALKASKAASPKLANIMRGGV